MAEKEVYGSRGPLQRRVIRHAAYVARLRGSLDRQPDLSFINIDPQRHRTYGLANADGLRRVIDRPL